jgi:hypothetical protein
MKTPKQTTPTNPESLTETETRRQPTEQEIAARAHEMYESQGRPDGRAEEHWFAAKDSLDRAATDGAQADVKM